MESLASPAASGILYAEDFGNGRRSRPAPMPPQRPVPPALTQADIDAACIRAVQAAERAWSASAEERRAEALGMLAGAIAEATEAAERQAELVAGELARTALGLLAGALPEMCRRHGPTEVRALVRQVAPLLAQANRLVIRVHPDLIGPLAADIEALDGQVAANIELRPANLPPGDVRLAWEDGSIVRDCAAIGMALRDALAPFGLAPVTTNTGAFAHAE